MTKISNLTRTGDEGKIIFCPCCRKGLRVFGFDWGAQECPHCHEFSHRKEWILVKEGVMSDRSREVYAICKKNPYITFKSIGKQLVPSVTAERVRQIIDTNNARASYMDGIEFIERYQPRPIPVE